MLLGSRTSGFPRQVTRIAVAAGFGCALTLAGASVAWSQAPDNAQAPSAEQPANGAQHGAEPPANPGQPRSAESPTAPPSKIEGANPATKIADDEVERKAEALSRSIMSPFCPGRTVSACPSPNAHAWREDIRKWVREGVSADEIRSRLAARMPEHNLLGAPSNRLGWALPVGIGVFSVVLLVLALRYLLKRGSTTKKGSDSAPPPGEDREDWDAKLKQELDALEQ
jgi:cytochrome c-type biogenesis protein CcmH/NrfF